MSAFRPFQEHLSACPVLVTGGTGRVGRHLVAALLECDARVAVMTRSPAAAERVFQDGNVETRFGDLTQSGSLLPALSGIDILFHLASFTPKRPRGSIYEDPGHWLVTATGTKNLVDAAVASGCQRVIYFSSIKAMGEEAGGGGYPDDEASFCAPETIYGRAKLAAETEIITASRHGSIRASVLRLPMVYGLDGFGNLARMIDGVARGRFPPFPRLENHRSAVHVLDAVRAALLCAVHEAASPKTYLVTDGHGYSTRWIYEQICHGLGRDVPSWTLPYWFWTLGARIGTATERITQRPMPLTVEALRKLSGNAWFSSDKIQTELGFQPRLELGAEIKAMAGRYNRA